VIPYELILVKGGWWLENRKWLRNLRVGYYF